MAEKPTEPAEPAVIVKGVSKYFSPSKGQRSIKNLFTSMFTRNRESTTKDGYWALRDIDFEIKKGEFFGIVGRNGSGKSTLLKMIAGVYTPTKGAIAVNGKLVPFIELGVGFNPELSARDNVFLNGALLGFTRREMSAMYDGIVTFAELHDHMEVKLKNFSSGMQVRLAFSIAIRAKSDVLLIDEVLAVGDAAFQTKCIDYFYKLKKQGATVILVSHDKGTLERFCDRGILIDEGIIAKKGPIRDVLKDYTNVVLNELEPDDATQGTQEEEMNLKRTQVSISGTTTFNDRASKTKKFSFGDTITVEFMAHVKQQVINPLFGITIWQKNVDRPVFANNTYIEGNKATGVFEKGDVVIVRQQLPKLLNDGTYFVEPAVSNEFATVFYDQQPEAASFYISGSDNPYAILSSDSKLQLKKRVK